MDSVETSGIPKKSELTLAFEANRYSELRPEDWLDLVARGLNPLFFDNFHSHLPEGYRRLAYEKGLAAGRIKDDDPRVEFYAEVDKAIKDLDADQLRAGSGNVLNRVHVVEKKPFGQLDDPQKRFFRQYIDLYKRLRENGHTHYELTG